MKLSLASMPKVLTAIGLLIMLSAAGLARANPSAMADMQFAVIRDGQHIGHHRISFNRDGDRLLVSIDVAVEVRAGVLPIFVFRHTSREAWQDNRLLSIEAETYENGEFSRVTGRQAPTGFRVDGPSGTVLAPADVRPTSFWRADTVQQERLLDTQRGQLIKISITPVKEETLGEAGHQILVRRFRVTGDVSAELWYAGSIWAKMRFFRHGARVEYRPDTNFWATLSQAELARTRDNGGF